MDQPEETEQAIRHDIRVPVWSRLVSILTLLALEVLGACAVLASLGLFWIIVWATESRTLAEPILALTLLPSIFVVGVAPLAIRSERFCYWFWAKVLEIL